MMQTSKYAWLELSQENFNHNINTFYQTLLPGTKLAPVLKSNAYGHGLEHIGSFAQAHPHIYMACVINEQEAVRLRSTGFTKPILIIGYIQDYSLALHLGCEITVYDFDVLYEIMHHTIATKTPTRIHIKIDTGLARLGFFPEDMPKIVKLVKDCPHITIVGVMSHFSDPYNKEYTQFQIDQFHKACTLGNFSHKVIKHICNTNGTFWYPQAHMDMVRIGIGTYGQLPQVDTHTLLPVGTLKAPVIHTKTVQPHCYIGYGRLICTDQPTTIGIIPLGYHEALDRSTDSSNYVNMNGYKAPLIGRVSMNLATIDLTNIPEQKRTDWVTILGCELTNQKFQDPKKHISAYEQFVRIDKDITKIIL